MLSWHRLHRLRRPNVVTAVGAAAADGHLPTFATTGVHYAGECLFRARWQWLDERPGEWRAVVCKHTLVAAQPEPDGIARVRGRVRLDGVDPPGADQLALIDNVVPQQLFDERYDEHCCRPHNRPDEPGVGDEPAARHCAAQ